MSAAPTVLVTGAGGGIGAGVARVLGERGWHVVVNDIDAEAAERVATEVGGTGVGWDVTTDAAGLVERAVAATGRLDGLVNNAGVIRRGALAGLDPVDVEMTWAVNLRALVELGAAALPHLAAVQGSVVNIASMAAEVPQLGGGIYGATKAAVVSLTRQAAVEWGPSGVRVNAVGPGMIRTEMAEVVYSDPVLYEKRRALVPVGRIGVPEDIGRVVAFLLSPDAAYVSGQHILVDGGLTQTLMAHFPQPGDTA